MKLLPVSMPAMLLLTLFTGKTPVEDVISKPMTCREDTVSMTRAYAAPDGAIELYDRLRLDARGLSKESFLMAMQGYRELKDAGRLRNKNVLTIIDYTLSSLKRRLFVVDIKNGKLLYNTYVAHGMRSGKEFARKFSNVPESKESSLGFYVTMNDYKGKNGVTLRLKGVERGINDNALRRGIVLHGARYVAEHYSRQLGFMGRSEGCPAVPQREAAPIIRSIRNGSAVFAYYPSQLYLGKSRLLENNSKILATR